jgi:superoxide dismutase|tara:strand:+ start:123 stop:377 length:255 start_codon:yes stop_codon:yes gene_type:complete
VSLNFRDDLIKASEKQFEAQIDKHRINVEILLENTVGVAEHPDIMETIEKELGIISEYEDKLSVLKKYFGSGWAAGKKKEVLNG